MTIRPMETRPPVPEPGLQATAKKEHGPWQEEQFSFADILDMVNPLQHLPVIATLYRENTGDAIGPVARLVGGALFGGLLGSVVAGLATAAANLLVREESGLDMGEHLMALLDEPGSATGQPPGEEINQSFQLVAEDLPVLSRPTVPAGEEGPTLSHPPLQTIAQRYRQVAESGEVPSLPI